MVDLDFVEKEDFDDLGLSRTQQARLTAAMEIRDTAAAVPAPAPAPVKLTRVTSGVSRDMRSPSQDVCAFLASVGCEDSGESFNAYGVRTLDDMPFLLPDDLESLGLSATQQRELTAALAKMFPEVAPAVAASARPTLLEFIPSKQAGGPGSSHPVSSHPVTPTADPLESSEPMQMVAVPGQRLDRRRSSIVA